MTTDPAVSNEPLTEQQDFSACQVVPPAGSRLSQLHAAYADAKAAVDSAQERLKAITDSIKAELQAAAPDYTKVILTGTEGARPLQLQYVESWRVDAKKLKAENPLVYVTYAVRSGSWRLAPVRGGGESE